jgi:hypothetical protein
MRTFVRLLGRASIRVGDQAWEPAADRRSALPYYLATTGAWVPRDDLLYLFWPDSEEEKGRSNLRQLLVTIRGLPFVEGIELDPAPRGRPRHGARRGGWGAGGDDPNPNGASPGSAATNADDG